MISGPSHRVGCGPWDDAVPADTFLCWGGGSSWVTVRGIVTQEKKAGKEAGHLASSPESATYHESSGLLIDRVSSFLPYEDSMK